MWALVPLKSPALAKSRLRPVLGDAQRCELFFLMAQRVLGTLSATPGIDEVAVITASSEVEQFARRLGAQVIREREDCGTAQAFIKGIEELRPRKLERLLMISGDLPLLSSPSLLRLIAAASHAAAVAIAPDRLHCGTNALLCAPPEALPICFGVDSYRRHLAAASERGLDTTVVEADDLGLDVDTPEDLETLHAQLRAQPNDANPALRTLLMRHRRMGKRQARQHGANTCEAQT